MTVSAGLSRARRAFFSSESAQNRLAHAISPHFPFTGHTSPLNFPHRTSTMAVLRL